MKAEELLTVREILDDDYGCEELPEGAEPMVTVILMDARGEDRYLHLADSLTRQWRPGDRIVLRPGEVPIRADADQVGGS